jgi:hypothetical protein
MEVQVRTSVSVQDITTKRSDSGEEEFTGLDLTNGTHVEAALVVFAVELHLEMTCQRRAASTVIPGAASLSATT